MDRSKDRERARLYDARYRQKHRVAIAIKNRLYKQLPHIRRRNRNQRRKYHREYYLRHKAKTLERAREWAQSHREKTRIYKREYKRRLRKKRVGYIPKIARVVKEYLEYCRERHAEETIRHYTRNLERFLKYLERPGVRCAEYHRKKYHEYRKPEEDQDSSWTKEFHKIRFMDKIDRELITNYVSNVNCDAINDSGIKLNQSEKESRLYPLKSFLLYCQKRGYTKKDLRKFIIVPSREKKVLRRVLTPEEMERLLATPDDRKITGIRDRALLELSYSGFRANEMLTLKIKELDLQMNTVSILDGKGHKDRVVPMTREAIYWIKRWLTRRNEFVKGRQDPGNLFITKGAKPLFRRQFAHLLKRHVKRAELPLDVAPHDLRRATATHLAENGAPIRLIQALLGHATLKVTSKYLRLSDEKTKKEHKETHPSNRRRLYYGEFQR